MNLLYGNLRDYKLDIYTDGEKMNKQKRGPIAIDMNIHLSNVLTDHFSNSLSEKTSNDTNMIFYSVISR